ncbi:Calcium uniporter protein, mitochondrial [Geodia barretti]|uniref:Calcium uniporter protein n=1 Tax=Geodia barretti TaxID=519541 RepID=A0AA35X0T5_GEOBA|nr:Calcium uniporter protein, mitochondrial [Geodia barretti]
MSWMSVQFGFLAYLVWWEYDWDIMEPVTYFVATGTSIVLFSYFLLTRQEYSEGGGHERYYLNYFHRRAKRQGFDVHRYNQLKEAIGNLRQRMDRLHDPLQLNLPSPSPSTNLTAGSN